VKYLDWTIQKGFVKLTEDGLVHLTPAGSEAYDELVSWILDHVGSLKLSRLREGRQESTPP
jgi:hypothetical protein